MKRAQQCLLLNWFCNLEGIKLTFVNKTLQCIADQSNKIIIIHDINYFEFGYFDASKTKFKRLQI